MSKPGIQTGAHSTLVYRWEDAGWTESPDDDSPKTFGKDATLSTFEGSRNAVEVFEPNSREVEEWIEQNFEGSWAVDFVFANPWWLRGLIDTASTSGSEAPYEHTFDGEEPSSLQIVTGNTKSGEDWTLKGCVMGSATISVEVTGNVSVSINGAYADLEEDTPADQETQVSEEQEAFNFVDASLAIGSDVQRLIQSLTLTVSNNIDPVYELGAETAVDFSPKARMLTVEHVQTRDDQSDEGIERFLGDANTLQAPDEDAMTIDLDNGESGADSQSVAFDLTSAFPNEFSVDNTGDPDSNIENNLTNRPVGITATAENDVETAK